MQETESKTYMPRPRKPEGFDAQWRPIRVLVVDDEEIVRKLVSQVLKSAGYEVVGEAGDGKRAVDMYKTLRPNLVTMDVEMPYLNGIDALEQILAIDPKAVVVMLTNEKEKYTVAKIIKAGAKDYIVKPIKRQIILEKLRKVRGVPD
jgi:two-component system, chemotaxis family, chemotaxis protein CheY